MSDEFLGAIGFLLLVFIFSIFYMGNKGVLKEKSFKFAVRIINLQKYLLENKKEFIISKQVIRSGTSIGANVREAQNAESPMDFIHKLSLAQKECDETIYWLELLVETKFITSKSFSSLNNDARELLKIIKSAIITTKQKLRK